MIQLRKLTSNDFDLIYKWCSNKTIYEWFEQRPLSKEEIIKKYTKKLKEKKQELYIIQYLNKEIGLTQIYPYEIDNSIYEFDIFIGEEDQNKGIGVQAIQEIKKYIYETYHPNAILLRPFKRNTRAIHCYEKCGFKILREEESTDTLNHKETIVIMMNQKEDNHEI